MISSYGWEDEDDILRQFLEHIDTRMGSEAPKMQSRIALVLASRLCEKVAFAHAGDWEAVSVADLLLLSAQIERFSLKDHKLD